jgi:hypothetical protein
MNKLLQLKKLVPKSWACDDCGTDLGERLPSRAELTDAAAEFFGLYILRKIKLVRAAVWAEAGGQPDGWLCDDCLEKRLGRRLQPQDYEPKPRLDDMWPF